LFEPLSEARLNPAHILNDGVVACDLQLHVNGSSSGGGQRRRTLLADNPVGQSSPSSSGATQVDGVTVYYDIGNVDAGAVPQAASALDQSAAVNGFRQLLIARGAFVHKPTYHPDFHISYHPDFHIVSEISVTIQISRIIQKKCIPLSNQAHPLFGSRQLPTCYGAFMHPEINNNNYSYIQQTQPLAG
jgi:hypothetical protein